MANESHESASGLTRQAVSLTAFVGLLGGLILVVVFLVGYDAFRKINHDRVYERYLSAGDPDLEALRTRERIALTSYGWVDQEKTRVRVPIERAKELLLEEAGAGE